jgi:hypothetical protein
MIVEGALAQSAVSQRVVVIEGTVEADVVIAG